MLLRGIRVVALETGLAGPLCTRLLADLGADVVKVERPGAGDVTRGWDTIARGLSSGFVWVNRGKRSVALDAKDPDSRPALEALAASADVFLENLTPGVAERLGLGEPARVGVSICDLAAGSYAAFATVAALVRRAETGEGARVSVSLFDTMVDWLGYFPHMWWHRRELPARTGTHQPLFCP